MIGKIGPYTLLEKIARGGMGEVYLAHDPTCDRTVALKKIRQDLIKYPVIRERFLREAKIAAGLTHPSIIPIYAIHESEGELYYTMPFIEGRTLKEIVKEAKKSPTREASIPSLMRIFLKVCEATFLAHSRGFIHRDLKPDNILVGKFGEVMIIDWGLAMPIDAPLDDDTVEVEGEVREGLTRPGKVVGTVSFLAPERAHGGLSSIKTDIYSLGVMLYLLLTLKLPFKRKSLKHFRERGHEEALIDPSEASPFRDIPNQLSQIVKKCLESNPEERPASARTIIAGLKNYIEGRPEWRSVALLDRERVLDWEFQETVLLTKQKALSHSHDLMEWVVLMISKRSFKGNMRLKTRIKLDDESQGIGFLLSVPEPKERSGLEDGYCLWLGSGVRLYRCNTEVAYFPEIQLERGRYTDIVIEKREHSFTLILDGKIVSTYASQLPLFGSHIGLLYADTHFTLDKLQVQVSAQNLMVNCLAVPDAFFASKEFGKAHHEYVRIAASFSGRAEGREALFRAGISLIEASRAHPEKKEEQLSEALEIFEQLRATPSAPLEYLGKSLVYKEEGDIEEEIKCLELALRRYKDHPLISLVEEHVHYRLHECAKSDRTATFHLLLLAIRLIRTLFKRDETLILFDNVAKSLDHPDFLPRLKASSHPETPLFDVAIKLAYQLGKAYALSDILDNHLSDHEEHQSLEENIRLALSQISAKRNQA